jgi:cell division initiation protein
VKLTPLYIKKQEFKKSLRGYDPIEVDTFLEMLSNEFEELTKQNKELKDKVAELELQVKDYRQQEKALQQPLIQAQEMADKTMSNAQREAAMILKDAEAQSTQMMEQAKAGAAQMTEQAQTDAIRMTEQAQTNAVRTTEQAQADAIQMTEQAQADVERLKGEIAAIQIQKDGIVNRVKELLMAQLALVDGMERGETTTQLPEAMPDSMTVTEEIQNEQQPIREFGRSLE